MEPVMKSALTASLMAAAGSAMLIGLLAAAGSLTLTADGGMTKHCRAYDIHVPLLKNCGDEFQRFVEASMGGETSVALTEAPVHKPMAKLESQSLTR
jgi:hypothetical protein